MAYTVVLWWCRGLVCKHIAYATYRHTWHAGSASHKVMWISRTIAWSSLHLWAYVHLHEVTWHFWTTCLNLLAGGRRQPPDVNSNRHIAAHENRLVRVKTRWTVDVNHGCFWTGRLTSDVYCIDRAGYAVRADYIRGIPTDVTAIGITVIHDPHEPSLWGLAYNWNRPGQRQILCNSRPYIHGRKSAFKVANKWLCMGPLSDIGIPGCECQAFLDYLSSSCASKPPCHA